MTGVQCSCCGLHGAVLIIISFRAYNLTSREFQVVNAPRRFGVPFKARKRASCFWRWDS